MALALARARVIRHISVEKASDIGWRHWWGGGLQMTCVGAPERGERGKAQGTRWWWWDNDIQQMVFNQHVEWNQFCFRIYKVASSGEHAIFVCVCVCVRPLVWEYIPRTTIHITRTTIFCNLWWALHFCVICHKISEKFIWFTNPNWWDGIAPSKISCCSKQ